MLQEKFSQHPGLFEAKAQLDLLNLELERYKSFCDLGERANLENDIVLLRNHLTVYLESETSRSLKQRRFSLLTKDSLASLRPTQLLSVDAEPEVSAESSSTAHDDDNSLRESAMEGPGSQDLDAYENDRDSDEEDFHLLVQDLREERDHYMQLAERRQKELEGEKRYAGFVVGFPMFLIES